MGEGEDEGDYKRLTTHDSRLTIHGLNPTHRPSQLNIFTRFTVFTNSTIPHFFPGVSLPTQQLNNSPTQHPLRIHDSRSLPDSPSLPDWSSYRVAAPCDNENTIFKSFYPPTLEKGGEGDLKWTLNPSNPSNSFYPKGEVWTFPASAHSNTILSLGFLTQLLQFITITLSLNHAGRLFTK